MAVQGPLNITPYLPSPPPPLAPQRRRHCDLWIAVGILAALLALLAAAFVKFAEPAKFAYGFLSGKPSIPGCNTAIAGEATVGPLWYRVVNVACPDETTMHFVDVKRGSGPGFIVFPALMSIGDPVPVSVRQRGADDFEIVLEKPLPDGRASLSIEFDRDGSLKEIQSFDHGRRSAMIRPIESLLLPAATGTIMVIGRVG